MPIRPENQGRYPKNWKSEVVPRIRARSGNRCECTGQCGVVHGAVGLNHSGSYPRCKARNGQTGYWDEYKAWHVIPAPQPGEPATKIVLTVMHLDHQPENCADDNLLHGCQGCHLRYDAPRKQADMKARRHTARASGDLFQCEEAPDA